MASKEMSDKEYYRLYKNSQAETEIYYTKAFKWRFYFIALASINLGMILGKVDYVHVYRLISYIFGGQVL